MIQTWDFFNKFPGLFVSFLTYWDQLDQCQEGKKKQFSTNSTRLCFSKTTQTWPCSKCCYRRIAPMETRPKNKTKETEKFLHLNKSLCQYNYPTQTKSNRISKSPGLMYKRFLDDFSVSQREDRKETKNGTKQKQPCICFLRGSLNTQGEWSWASLEERSSIWQAFWDSTGFGPRWGKDLGVDLPAEHSRLFGYMDTRGLGEASTRTEIKELLWNRNDESPRSLETLELSPVSPGIN